MPTYTVNGSSLTAVADAIRQKGGTSAQLVFPSGFIQAIRNIHTSGTYQSKSGVMPTKSSQTITPDSGYDALLSVQINPIPSQYIVPSGNLEITSNGTSIDVSEYATVTVNVPSADGISITDEPDGNGGTIRHISGVVISGTKVITENGTDIDVSSYARVTVNVSSN